MKSRIAAGGGVPIGTLMVIGGLVLASLGAGAQISPGAGHFAPPRRPDPVPPQAARGDVSVWGGGGLTLQRKAVFELRDWDGAGADCTGRTDSSPFLNGLTGSTDPTGTSFTISGRDCSLLRADHWVVQGQEYLELDLGPKGPGTRGQGGTWLFGCSGSGATLQINRSGYTHVHGGAIVANSYLCPGHTSSLTGSIEYTNSGSDGYTSTHNKLSDTYLAPGMNGEVISGYKAYWIHGTPNQEEFRLRDVEIGCNFSPGSIGFYSDDVNADSTTWDGGGVEGCYRGVEMDAGRVRLYSLNSSYNGGYGVFGPGGASIYENGGCVTTIEETVWAEGSGQFLNMAGDSSYNNCGAARFWRSNQIRFDDIDPAAYPVNLNAGVLILAANSFGTYKPLSQIHNGVLVGTDLPATGLTVGVVDLGGNTASACCGVPLPLTLPSVYGSTGAQATRPQDRSRHVLGK